MLANPERNPVAEEAKKEGKKYRDEEKKAERTKQPRKAGFVGSKPEP